jgi:hypothetical protein
MTLTDLAEELARTQASLLDAGPWLDSVNSVEDSYRVQSQIAQLVGNDMRGWKVTALSPEKTARLFGKPTGGRRAAGALCAWCAGAVLAGTVRRAAARMRSGIRPGQRSSGAHRTLWTRGNRSGDRSGRSGDGDRRLPMVPGCPESVEARRFDGQRRLHHHWSSAAAVAHARPVRPGGDADA